MIPFLIFAVSAGFIVYVVVLFPVLAGLIARRRGRPVRRAPAVKSVSVLVAVHNGEKFLRAKLESLLALDYPRDLVEIFVLADGCTDATEKIAAEFYPHVQLISLPRGGKPAALNHGIRAANNEILLLTDVRQRLAPDCLRRLVENFADPDVGVVSGELVILQGDTHEEANVGLYWRYESWLRDQLSRIDSMFGATGPIYAMRRSLAVEMPPEILLDDMYLPLAAFFRGYRLVVDTRARAFDYPTSLDTEFRRKVRTLAGNFQLLQHCPKLLTPQNRMLFYYLSYKLFRLLLPYALAALFISALFLPAPWREVMLAAQIAGYLLAAVDRYIPQHSALKKLSSPARTFMVMMVATVYAVSVFFVPPQSLWKVTDKVGAGKAAA